MVCRINRKIARTDRFYSADVGDFHSVKSSMDEETFYPQKSLSKLTDGCSNTNSFRLWLHRYIKDTSQEIPNDEMQYRLLCHLKALEFWDGFEDIRNLHYVRKPFIVKDYGEHSEDQNEANPLFNRAINTGRQVIVVLPVNKRRESRKKI